MYPEIEEIILTDQQYSRAFYEKYILYRNSPPARPAYDFVGNALVWYASLERYND